VENYYINSLSNSLRLHNVLSTFCIWQIVTI